MVPGAKGAPTTGFRLLSVPPGTTVGGGVWFAAIPPYSLAVAGCKVPALALRVTTMFGVDGAGLPGGGIIAERIAYQVEPRIAIGETRDHTAGGDGRGAIVVELDDQSSRPSGGNCKIIGQADFGDRQFARGATGRFGLK